MAWSWDGGAATYMTSHARRRLCQRLGVDYASADRTLKALVQRLADGTSGLVFVERQFDWKHSRDRYLYDGCVWPFGWLRVVWEPQSQAICTAWPISIWEVGHVKRGRRGVDEDANSEASKMGFRTQDYVIFNPLTKNDMVAPVVASPEWLEPWQRYRVEEVSECGTLLYLSLDGREFRDPVVACWFDLAQANDTPEGDEAKAICEEIAETARKLEELHQRLRRLSLGGC